MRDDQQYRRYSDWCHRLGLKAADFATWARTTNSLSEYWNAVRADIMRGRSASRIRPGATVGALSR